jgi:uncharacterized protein YidB (DUF937 family)
MNNRGFPSMTALLGLVAIAGYQNRDKIAEILKGLGGKAGELGSAAGQTAQEQVGGLRDMLGGLSTGTLLNGGLNELLEKFRQSGHQETADSWVGTGPNRTIAPGDLRKVLGSDMLHTLAQVTGLSEDELVSRLSRDLPQAVDKYTPEGRIVHA